MAKIVCYNGGTESFYICTRPTDLVRGKKYEVVSEDDLGWQTDYTLKGVKGHFNSCWFDEVSDEVSSRKTFMAIAHTVPMVGKRCDCYKIEFVNGQPELIGLLTSTVKEIMDMGNNIYQVTTCNSVYIVQVG